jgi:hypothetical protein
MGLMISVVLLLGASVLGAWRMETEFDRETRLLSTVQPADQTGPWIEY